MFETRPEGIAGQGSAELFGIDPAWLPDLTQHYARERFVQLPGLLSADDAGELLEAAHTVPTRRVRCGLEHVVWNEQTFEPGHPAYEFFRLSEIAELATTLTGLRDHRGLTAWTSIYGPGEYINPHCDSSGSIHLLLCLQAPSDVANGGELIVNGARMFLQPGDAVAFEATALEHYTTPLVATAQESNPQRVVLVGRYFLA